MLFSIKLNTGSYCGVIRNRKHFLFKSEPDAKRSPSLCLHLSHYSNMISSTFAWNCFVHRSIPSD